MKILTVRQPWAALIVSGPKDIENRTWATSYRGPVLIQASAKKPVKREWQEALDYAWARGITLPDDSLRFGGIVGIANLVCCTRCSSSPWFMGPIGWLLKDRHPLPFVPITGQLGLFDCPAEVLGQIKLPEAFLPLVSR
jgi:hypothetical protein